MDLIDRESLVKWLKDAGWYLHTLEGTKSERKMLGKIIDHVEAMPTVDAEPVVRCRDCFHFEPYGHRDAVGVCKLHNNSEWRGEEDYCSKWHEDGE